MAQNSAGQTDWRPLVGKEIVILPDYDAAGRAYADAVAAILARLTPAPAVRIVELPDLPDHGDIVDWTALHGEPAQPANLRGRIEALADAVEPVRVEPIHDAPLADALRHEPYPVDALPEPLCGFVRAGAKAIGCDPSYVALPLLTVLAAAIGGTRRLLLKRGWSAPAILWAAIVGESGTAKTPAYKSAMQAIRKRQRKALQRHADAMQEYEAELAQWDKAMAEWKRNKKSAVEPPVKPEPPQAARCIVSDTTVEALAPLLLANPRGLLLRARN